jgi:hypothetical protein
VEEEEEEDKKKKERIFLLSGEIRPLSADK